MLRIEHGWLPTACLILAPAGAASAGTKVLATGSTFYSGSVIVDTICLVTNVGTKPVMIANARLQNYPSGSPPPTSDNCSGTPLAPDGSCAFSGSLGVYGGGRIEVQGSTKSLRGHCALHDPAGNAVQVLELR